MDIIQSNFLWAGGIQLLDYKIGFACKYYSENKKLNDKYNFAIDCNLAPYLESVFPCKSKIED